MKAIPMMAGALVLVMLTIGSVSVVAAYSTKSTSGSLLLGNKSVVATNRTETSYAAEYELIVDDYDEIPDDDYEEDINDVTDVNTGENENVVILHGRGTLFAMGSGRAELRGTGIIVIFAKEANVIVSSNAWVRALGNWNVEYLGNGKVKYTGSGVLQIRGRFIAVDISGNDISLKASGRGSVTLNGNWDYWVIHQLQPYQLRPHQLRPCCCVRPAIAANACCQNSVTPVTEAPAGCATALE